VSFATGANELSPLDMAAGIQTVANEGVHQQPYYVDYITDAGGARTYTHFDPGTKVFDQDKALLTIDILKGVLRSGTAFRHSLANDRAAFGKTGTQQDNTNAWFVGGTKQLSTAVWVGDPDAYTPMVEIDEFLALGVRKVQGGLFPAEIWKAFMDPAHAFLPPLDWDAPPAPKRPNARLFLPGNECLVEVVGFEVVEPEVDPDAPPTTPPTRPPAEDAPPTETVPPETIPIVELVEVGTTIAPDNLDPNAPLPTIEVLASIGPCL
jgi:membrane peptidoglycan carboxypeptidase